MACEKKDSCIQYDEECTNARGYLGRCFYKRFKQQKPIESLHGRTKAEQKQEILDRMACFYLQTNTTMDWPNSREGDLLKMVHALLTA